MLKLLPIILVALALTACSKKKEALLVSDDLKTQLRYDCGNLQPKAKTSEDVALLLNYAAKISDEYAANGDAVSAYDVAVIAMKDIRALEKYVAAHECKRISD